MRDSGLLLQIVHEGMVKAGLDIQAIYQRLGYDAEKLALRELRTLRAKERLPSVRPQNVIFDGRYEIPTFQEIIDLVHKAQQEFDKTKRQDLYNQLQVKAAESAFMAFLFYTPFPYASTSNVKGFKVLPTGSYHMEDVSL